MSDHNEEPGKPFNDAMEHLHKVEGFPINKGGRLPLPIRLISYFMFGRIILMTILGLLGNFIPEQPSVRLPLQNMK